MRPVVYARGLRKHYGELVAVDGIDLEVHTGEVFGLIGPDGAGKTTIFKILAGVMEPSGGEVEVLGRSPREARFGIGYLTQPFSLYLDLSVEENLRYSAGLREIAPSTYEGRSAQYLRLMGLERFRERLASQLSGGMKQKLALCCALVAKPELLLLDEPTTGVDPVSRRDFWDTLLALSTEGMTIVVATPYLDEAERCHRVGLIRAGQIQQADTPAGLRAALGMTRLEIHTPDLERAEDRLSGVAGIADVQRFGDRLDVMVRDAAQGEAAVRQVLGDLPVTALRRASPTLENAFVTILRSKTGEQEAPPFPRARRDAPANSRADAETPGRGDAGTRRHGDGETRGRGNAETGILRGGPRESLDGETHRDAETRRRGGAETGILRGGPGESLGSETHRDEETPGRGVGDTAIGAYELRKRFGGFEAVKGVTLEVRYGEIYGLLGANGAGKTTVIKMLCGLIEPTRGEVRLLGKARRLRRGSLRRQMGYMSQKFSLYDDLTIAQNLDFYAGVYGVPPEWRAARCQWVLQMAGLERGANLLTGKLPGGWKQRVAFGAAIMHEPRVLFLDEPTSGVDPVARRAFWRLIHELADDGVAVLVTTHYLEEAEQCNRLGLMADGELIAQGTPREVKHQMREHLLEVETDQPQRALAVLGEHYGHHRVSLFGAWLHVVVEHPDRGAQEVKARLGGAGLAVRRMDEIPVSLEDVFIYLIEQRKPPMNADGRR